MTTMSDQSVVIEHGIGQRGRLTVNLASAEIRLAAADGDQVVVRTPAGSGLPDRVIVETSDDGLTIREKDPGIGFGRGRRVVQLEIHAPATTEITIAIASGWLDVIGFRGEQHYRAVSGETRLRDVAGAIELSTVSGDAAIDLAGPTELAIKSVSGDVKIRGGRLDALRIGSTSGDIQVHSPLTGTTGNTIETLSGDVQLLATSGIRVEARTVSGDLSSDLPHRSDGRMGRRTLVVGDGSVEVAFRSVSGDLRILDAGRTGPTPPVAPLAPAAPIAPEPPRMPFSDDFDVPDIDLPDIDLPDLQAPELTGDAPAATPPAAGDPFETERMTILRALERGELDVATAMDRLAALDEAPKPDPEHRR